MVIRITEIRLACMDRPGMFDAFLSQSKIHPDKQALDISRADFDAIMAKHCPGGLGNVIHEVLKPVVKVVDKVAGTDLANCGGCAERQLRMNAATAAAHSGNPQE